jgi:hypothetical protein
MATFYSPRSFVLVVSRARIVVGDRDQYTSWPVSCRPSFWRLLGTWYYGRLFVWFRFGFVSDRKKPEVVCDEVINETCGDNFFWSLRAVLTRAVLWNGGKKKVLGPRNSFSVGLNWHGVLFLKFLAVTVFTLCWSCRCTWLLKTSIFCLIAESICDTFIVYTSYLLCVELFS